MTRNQNHDEASSGITIKTCENRRVAPWSDLHHDVLLLVMMRLRVIDFLAFVGVCKSWRSLAVSNRNTYLASRAPMTISFSTNANDNKCCLTDYEGRKLTPTLPHSNGRTCVGLTCGYLILFGEKSKDFWLVNLVTRHELHFPYVPIKEHVVRQNFRAILVFLPSTSEWVLVVFTRDCYHEIWFCKAGQREWTKLSSPLRILDLQAFKGRIYALLSGIRFSEVRLYPTPKVTFLEINNFPKPDFDHPVLVSSGENLCVMERYSKTSFKIINFSKVEGVSLEKIRDEFALFWSNSMPVAPVISYLPSQYKSYAITIKGPERNIIFTNIWYCFHDCLNVNLLQQ